MGLDWGFYLKNKKTKDEVRLMDFCGWNSRTLLRAVLDRTSGKDGETVIGYDNEVYDNDCYFIVDEKSLMSWLSIVERIDKIFAKVSSRKIEEESFDDKVLDKYADLCYDLDIELDTYNIFALMRLSTFSKILKQGSLFDNSDWYLCVYQSY